MENELISCNLSNMNENRVLIGRTFDEIPYWKLVIGIPLIYLPAFLVLPFVILGVFLVRGHLKFMGAKNIKKYKDFIPSKESFRYSLKTQVVCKGKIMPYLRSKIYWFYNCGIYCPYSIAIFRYMSYLVEIVENWWCSFGHDKKNEYFDARIDQSFWHIDEERKKKLHEDDLKNPIWNDEK